MRCCRICSAERPAEKKELKRFEHSMSSCCNMVWKSRDTGRCTSRNCSSYYKANGISILMRKFDWERLYGAHSWLQKKRSKRTWSGVSIGKWFTERAWLGFTETSLCLL